MSISAMVAEMAEAGASAQMIAIAVRHLEAMETAERERRSKRAAQKAAERERQSVARQSRDCRATVAATTLSDKKESPHTPIEKITLPIQSSLRSDLSPNGQNGHLVDTPKPKLKPKRENSEADAIVDYFLDGWSAAASQCGLSGYRAITDSRRAKILARARDLSDALDFPDYKIGFGELFIRIRGSPFLLGREGNRAWKCDIDWVLTESNFLKIFEGKYAQKAKQFQGFGAAQH